MLVTSGSTWNTETLMSASSPEKGGCGMSMIVRSIEEIPQGGRERQGNKRCVS